jgi:hypothetical protein
MKTSRYAETQTISIWRQAEGGVLVSELCCETAVWASTIQGSTRSVGFISICMRDGPPERAWPAGNAKRMQKGSGNRATRRCQPGAETQKDFSH